MIEVAQLAERTVSSPSCFEDLMVHFALLARIDLPLTMKPEPNRSESSAKLTALPFLTKTRSHSSCADAQAPDSSNAPAWPGMIIAAIVMALQACLTTALMCPQQYQWPLITSVLIGSNNAWMRNS